MTTEAKRQLVTETWKAFMEGRLKDGFAGCADDVAWTVPGTLPISGTKRGKGAIRDFMASMAPVFPHGVRTEILRTFVDGDTVVLELTNRARTAKGRDYENDYCLVFELAGGKIREMREYVDTQKAKEILFD